MKEFLYSLILILILSSCASMVNRGDDVMSNMLGAVHGGDVVGPMGVRSSAQKSGSSDAFKSFYHRQ